MWFHLCVGLFIVRLCLFAFVARILCIGMIVTLFCHCLWVWWAVWVVRLQFEQLGVFIVVVGCFVGCSGLVVCSLFVCNLFAVGLVCACELCESLSWGWVLALAFFVCGPCDCSLGCVGGWCGGRVLCGCVCATVDFVCCPCFFVLCRGVCFVARARGGVEHRNACHGVVWGRARSWLGGCSAE